MDAQVVVEVRGVAIVHDSGQRSIAIAQTHSNGEHNIYKYTVHF